MCGEMYVEIYVYQKYVQSKTTNDLNDSPDLSVDISVCILCYAA